MTEQNKGRKKEFDADEAIRDYMESGDQPMPSDQDEQQTDME